MDLSSQVILQGFYWDVPVKSEVKEGIWYSHLEEKLDYLQKIGVTAIWLPPPSKGNWGIYDMGYGIYDHYDLGEYDQIGTISTRFGTRESLNKLIESAHKHNIEVYADVVLNHMYSFQNKDLEPNPIIKNYLLNRKKKTAGYPVNELRFGLDLKQNQTITIQMSNPIYPKKISGYRLKVSDDPSMNNANKKFHPILTKNTAFGFWEGIVDGEEKIEFKIYQNPQMKLWLQLEVLNENMSWGDQTNGLTISSIADEHGEELEWNPFSFTGIQPASGKMKWNYSDFHPSDKNDYIMNYPDTGGIVANSKLFGHDFNHRSENVQEQLTTWGKWLLDQVKYDGVRLDFVNGIEPDFIRSWTNNVVRDSAFCVTEFFTYSVNQIADWNKLVNSDNNAKVKSFDFPLKKALTEMCNDSMGKFDMSRLVNAGLISKLSTDKIITFAENHDTGKEHDKWIKKDWILAYSYILFHQPTPCLFYSHLFPTRQNDFNNKKHAVMVDGCLPEKIEQLIRVRSVLQGESIVDSALVNKNRYVVTREGIDNYRGAILILNTSAEDDVKFKMESFLKDHELLVNVLNPDMKVLVTNQTFTQKHIERGASLWMPVTDYEKLFNISK
ncbi:alpha-amylase family glycosyl hydrolase [Carboxylicivirga caseinilyticus]|uniref:alpha-amylase family glycosyl hydrolase n=1 Tax=Carboxylicivirga caseinilyticus TaxID=3417572 RepID=UPI003D32D2E0|nr:hypothetical protein [Marinilabiliaceae bacterium A049]